VISGRNRSTGLDYSSLRTRGCANEDHARTTTLPQGWQIGFIAVLAVLGFTACNEDSAGPEVGADVEDVREEPGIDGNDDAVGGAVDGDNAVGGDEELFEDPEPFLGERVTVSAEVAEVVSPAALRIAGEGFPESEPVLVVGAPNGVPNVDDDDIAEVTGTVREFAVADVEQELDIDLFVDYEDDHVIVASSVTIITDESSSGT
jgi:hypothetical protein